MPPVLCQCVCVCGGGGGVSSCVVRCARVVSVRYSHCESWTDQYRVLEFFLIVISFNITSKIICVLVTAEADISIYI